MLVICCYSNLLTAQISIVDDIDLGPTNFDLTSSPTADWGATHGTPNYSPTEINMWAQYYSYYNGGEGVFRIVDLPENRSYFVSISISGFNNPHSIPESFYVYLANDPIPANCSGSGCPIPTLSNSRLLYTYVGNTFSDKVLRLGFSTQPGESWKYLVIYPKAKEYAEEQVTMQINCLGVFSTCGGPDVTFCNGLLPTGIITDNSITMGSSICSGNPVYSNVNVNTNMIASEFIDLKPQTTISVTSGTTFTMEVSTCTSSINFVAANTINSELADAISPCDIARPMNAQYKLQVKDLTVFPNPCNGKFNLSVSGNLLGSNAVVINPYGRLIRKFKIEKTLTEVDLSEVSRGMYFLQISGKGAMSTEKVIVK